MKLAKVRAMIELEMVIPNNTPEGMPKNEEETENIRVVKELIQSKFNYPSSILINIVSVGII